MASLRKIGNRYYGYFYDRSRIPKRKSFPLGVKSESAAKVLLRRKEYEYALGTFDPWVHDWRTNSENFGSAVTAFLATRKKTCRPSTHATYEFVLRQFASRLPADIPAHRVSTHYVEQFVLLDRSIKRATRRMRYERLRACFRWMVKTGIIEQNPMAEISAPKVQRRVPRFLTQRQVEHLVATMENHRDEQRSLGLRPPSIGWLQDAILVAVSTGMRRGELCALQWEDVDLESGFITVRSREGVFETKSGHERGIPITPTCHEVLTRLRNEHDRSSEYVLRGASGGPLNAAVTSQRFKFYCRLAGLPEYICFHSLRHTTASWLVQNGVSLPIVQAILGHSSIEMTQRYAHLSPTAISQAMTCLPGIHRTATPSRPPSGRQGHATRSGSHTMPQS